MARQTAKNGVTESNFGGLVMKPESVPHTPY